MSYFILSVVLLPLGMVGKEDICGYPDEDGGGGDGVGGFICLCLFLLWALFRLWEEIDERISDVRSCKRWNQLTWKETWQDWETKKNIVVIVGCIVLFLFLLSVLMLFGYIVIWHC